MQQILSMADQLAPILQTARKAAGLNQTELAQRLGLSQSRISAMEQDPASLALHQLLAICSALQLELVVRTKPSNRPAPLAAEQPEW